MQATFSDKNAKTCDDDNVCTADLCNPVAGCKVAPFSGIHKVCKTGTCT